jgi:hypothetical protein
MKSYSVELGHHKYYSYWFIPQAIGEEDAIKQATEASVANNDGKINSMRCVELTKPINYGEDDCDGPVCHIPFHDKVIF